jgi:hypothetical protein
MAAKKKENFSSVMRGLADNYETAVKNIGQGRGGLAVGSYQLQVTGHEFKPIKKGKSQGQLGVVSRFAVASGKKTGKKHTKFYNLQLVDKKSGDPIGLTMFLEDLEVMGRKVKKAELKKLDKVAEETIGAIIEVEVVQNGRFKNTYINDLVQAPGDAVEEEEEEIDDEEIEEEEDEDLDEDEEEDDEEEENEDEDDVDLEDGEEEEEEEEPEPAPKRKRGRPKGSKNKPKKKKKDDDEDDIDSMFDD